MSNYQSVQVNEHTNEENISLEKQAAMQEEAKQSKDQQVSEQTPERPEWLPEKFKSAEDMANAYQELEKKQSTKQEEEKSNENTEEPKAEDPKISSQDTDAAIQKASESFNQNGKLGDKDYINLEKVGISREMVDTYIKGQEAIADGITLEIHNSVGGGDNYEAMSNWASENLPESEIKAYDNLVENASVDEAKIAVQGLYARFIQSGGKPPNLTQGNVTGSSVKPFNSAAQVTAAMSDPRYANDPAYRATIERRLAVSNNF